MPTVTLVNANTGAFIGSYQVEVGMRTISMQGYTSVTVYVDRDMVVRLVPRYALL